jgi:solute carrier family 35 protein E1
MAFLLMIPIWVYTDLLTFLSASPASLPPTKELSTAAHCHFVPTNFFLNSIFHFAKDILAFVILSSTSPVTYSIASLFNHIAIICIAIIWFQQNLHLVQALGIALTFIGLWMYNWAKVMDVENVRLRRTQPNQNRKGEVNRVEQA